MSHIPGRPVKELGVTLSPIGQGTMGIGGYYQADSTRDIDWIAGLRRGIDLGLQVIDTAEVYGAGHAEELVGRAIQGVREKVFIVSKFSAEHSRKSQVIAAAEHSLRRLRTDRIDVYQPHWPNPSVPFEETAEALDTLVRSGKVRGVGLSNFAFDEWQKASSLLSPLPVRILEHEYNLIDRTIEERVLPHCEASRTLVLAYSPLLQGKLVPDDARRNVLSMVANKYERTAAQIILAWLLRNNQVVVIPKGSTAAHLEEFAAVRDIRLDAEDLDRISAAYAPRITWIPVSRIMVRGGGYTTYHEALANQAGCDPSPQDLARSIVNGNFLKPVKVSKTGSEEMYGLTEGKIRFWAWVLAYGPHSSVPAFVEAYGDSQHQGRSGQSANAGDGFPASASNPHRVSHKAVCV